MSRQAIIDAAAAEIGPYDRAKVDKYWLEVLPPGQYAPGLKLAWCGAFALYCLHRAGLALDKHWALGKGFLLVPPHVLTTIKHPEPGDIGYLAQPFQHHFVVESVSGDLVHSIDGNQPDVARRTRKLESCVYYSIAPLLAASDTEPSPAPDPEPHATAEQFAEYAMADHPKSD